MISMGCDPVGPVNRDYRGHAAKPRRQTKRRQTMYNFPPVFITRSLCICCAAAFLHVLHDARDGSCSTRLSSHDALLLESSANRGVTIATCDSGEPCRAGLLVHASVNDTLTPVIGSFWRRCSLLARVPTVRSKLMHTTRYAFLSEKREWWIIARNCHVLAMEHTLAICNPAIVHLSKESHIQRPR